MAGPSETTANANAITYNLLHARVNALEDRILGKKFGKSCVQNHTKAL